MRNVKSGSSSMRSAESDPVPTCRVACAERRRPVAKRTSCDDELAWCTPLASTGLAPGWRRSRAAAVRLQDAPSASSKVEKW
jgi:hypothetical protein